MLQRFFSSLTLLCAAAAPCALAADPAGDGQRIKTERFVGYAYALEGGPIRYVELHERQRPVGASRDSYDGWSIRYVDANGEQLASKTIDPTRNPEIPAYQLKQSHGYAEGLRWEGDTLIATRTKDGETETERFTPNENSCADAGFDVYVRNNWDALTAGDWVTFDFILAGKLDDFEFRAKSVGRSEFEGRPATEFKVELSGMLRFVTPALELTYDTETRGLMEYRGIGNLPGDNGKPYPVRVAYFSEPPQDLPTALAAIVAQHLADEDPAEAQTEGQAADQATGRTAN